MRSMPNYTFEYIGICSFWHSSIWAFASYVTFILLNLRYLKGSADFCLSHHDCFSKYESENISAYCNFWDGKCKLSILKGDPCNSDLKSACTLPKNLDNLNSLMANIHSNDTQQSQQSTQLNKSVNAGNQTNVNINTNSKKLNEILQCDHRQKRCRNKIIPKSTNNLICRTNTDCPLDNYCRKTVNRCNTPLGFRQPCNFTTNFDLDMCSDGFICSPVDNKCVRKCIPESKQGEGNCGPDPRIACVADWSSYGFNYTFSGNVTVKGDEIKFGYCGKVYDRSKLLANEALKFGDMASNRRLTFAMIGIFSGLGFICLVLLILICIRRIQFRKMKKKFKLNSNIDNTSSPSIQATAHSVDEEANARRVVTPNHSVSAFH